MDGTNSSAHQNITFSPSLLESLKLPSDTEIIKYTSSSTGPKVPGTTNRGRKKTISLDPSPQNHSTSTSASLPAGKKIILVGGKLKFNFYCTF